MEWFSINKSELLDKDVQLLKVGGKNICLIRFGGDYFATSAKCPHAGADLSNGWCEDGYFVCPVHRYKYNLTTGRGETGQGDYLPTYPVKVYDERLAIGIKKSWFKFW